MTRTNVYNDGRVHVQSAKCSTCIYRPGNLMHLQPGRVTGMAAEAVAAGGVIPCHQTIHGQRDQESVCRGYFDVAKRDVWLLQVAERLGIIRWTKVGR
jgi:hypothetical protein